MNSNQNTPLSQIKTALTHDWLVGYRGGERVFEVFCDLFPSSEIYTLLHKPGSTSQKIDSHPIHTSALQKIPGAFKNYRQFLPLFPKFTENLKVSKDTQLILSSSHCVIKGLQKPSGAKSICYIHSPMRYLYDQYDFYFGPTAPLHHQLGMKLFKNYLTQWDYESNKHVDHFIANSHFVAQRVQKYYQREAEVIYPFVDLADFSHLQDSINLPTKKDYFLMVTAFAPNKRVDLAIKAFNHLQWPLKIIGGGQCEKELKELALPNIEFLGHVERNKIIQLMSEAQGFIFPGIEDFGITPLESLAAGTPVIAFAAGGVLETLNNETAHFFYENNENSLIEALKKYSASQFSISVLQQRARLFSKENFTDKIIKSIEKQLK